MCEQRCFQVRRSHIFFCLPCLHLALLVVVVGNVVVLLVIVAVIPAVVVVADFVVYVALFFCNFYTLCFITQLFAFLSLNTHCDCLLFAFVIN